MTKQEILDLKKLAGIKKSPFINSVTTKRRVEKTKTIVGFGAYLLYVLFLTILCSPIILLAKMGREGNFFEILCDDIFRHVSP